MRTALAGVCTVAVLVLAACSDRSGPEDAALLRLVTATADAPALDLVVDGKTVAANVSSPGASPFAMVDAGPAVAEIRLAGASAALATLPITLQEGRAYSVMASGPAASLSVRLASDTADAPDETTARFRIVVVGVPGAPALDVYLTNAGADLSASAPLEPRFQPTPQDSILFDQFEVRGPGSYEVRFTKAGTTDVLAGTGTMSTAAGESRYIFLSKSAGQTFRVDVFKDH